LSNLQLPFRGHANAPGHAELVQRISALLCGYKMGTFSEPYAVQPAASGPTPAAFAGRPRVRARAP
jgi:hypothetical protein